VAESTSADTHVGNRTKIERYNWKTSNTLGEYTLIPPHQINIDPVYQRIANHRKVIELARDWNWVACGCIAVVRRPDGTFVTPDGSHRVLAARKRSDIKHLPCLVWNMNDVCDEAQAFLALNTHRKPVEATDKYRAALVANDPVAIDVQRVLDLHGYKIQKGDGEMTVAGIAGLQESCKDDPALFSELFAMVVSIAKGAHIPTDVFLGLNYIERALRERNDPNSMLSSEVIEKLSKIGIDNLHRSCRKDAHAYGRGGKKVWATAILREINSGKRTRRIDPV